MAACEVRAELKYRDGTAKEFLQRCDKNLQSVLGAVRAVSVEVSVLLTELVSQERTAAGPGRERLEGSDDGNDTEGDEDDDSDERAETKRMTAEPPSKRRKILRA